MNNSEDLMYSPEASSTRYMYYKDINEINIFIEDSGKEYEYETIFQRLFCGELKIYSIFSTDGKQNIIKRFNEFGTYNRDNPKIKNFYIADSDFDKYIYKDEMIVNKSFIYLDTYNIENYFIDEKACLQFSKGKLCCTDKKVKEKVKFDEWKERIVEEASKLFLCYCFIKKFHPQIENVSRSPYLFLDHKTGFERSGAFEEYWGKISELDPDINNKISIIDNIYKKVNGNDYFNLICGKFLILSLYIYIRSIVKLKFSKDDFRWHLVSNFDVTKLNYIKSIILSS